MEELAAYAAGTPERARLKRQAARLLAISEMLMLNLGSDIKSTPRRLTALQAAADRQLARLDRIGARRKPADEPTLEEISARYAGRP